MEENADARIANLENKLGTLETFLNQRIKRIQDALDQNLTDLNGAYKMLELVHTRLSILEKHDDGATVMFKSLKSITDVQNEQIERIDRELMKHDDAYYRVFPERLAPDVRLLDQLAALSPKPHPDAEPKKK